jgi:signal transduction histidine kinase
MTAQVSRIDGRESIPVRSWWARATGPSLLRWPTVAIYAGVGMVPIVATIPEGDIPARDRMLWLAVAVLAQIGLSAVALLGGLIIKESQSLGARIGRVGVVLIGGALRGLIVQVSADALGLADPIDVATRMINSATTVLLWMAALAILVDGHREFRRLYREAFDRDIALTARAGSGDDGDEVVQRIDDHLRRVSTTARRRLDGIRGDPPDSDSSALVVQQAADAIRDLVTTHLRPLSHRLWFGAAGQPPRVRLGAVAQEAVSRAPLLTPAVLTLLTLGMIIGSVVRYGSAVAAVSGTVLIAVALGYVVVNRSAFAQAHPRRWNLITVPLFSVVSAVTSTQASAIVLDSGSDLPTIITIIIGIPAFGLIVGMAHVTTEDREVLLAAMSDPQAVRDAIRRVREREVATYVHNHVKSQLTASAMRMREAVRADDPEGVRAAAERAANVLSRPLPDAILLGRQSPAQRLAEVSQAWEGIADVDVDLPPDLSDGVMLVTADILAEAIANAVRSGGASHIVVTGRRIADEVLLTISDDGVGGAPSWVDDAMQGEEAPGLGTAWLDALVPGRWERDLSARGSTVRVRLPAAR